MMKTLAPLGLLILLAVGFLALRAGIRGTGSSPSVDAPLRAVPGGVASPAPAGQAPLALDGAGVEARIDVTHSAPDPVGKKEGNSVDTQLLKQRLSQFDESPTWQSSLDLLTECIVVECDSVNRFEDVTNKWDRIDPSNGHKLRKLPEFDPEVGFIDRMDARGTRWYRFGRSDYPEWFALRDPDPATVTGQPSGIATPKQVDPALAASIRKHAASVLEHYGEQH